MQHVSRMLDAPPEDPVFQHIAAYKHSAQELCAAAQVTTSKEPETVPMDTMLILFALDVCLCIPSSLAGLSSADFTVVHASLLFQLSARGKHVCPIPISGLNPSGA